MDHEQIETARDGTGHGSREGGSGSPPGPGNPTVRPDEAGPIGVFPNWRWVYTTVVVYGVLVILALLVLTYVLDPGGTR
jgi:hypothetical protein